MYLIIKVYISLVVFFLYLEFTDRSDIHSKKKNWFRFFFVAQLAFKHAKFYFQFQNDRAKGRMGPSWAVTSLTKVILQVFNRWRKIWHSLHLLFIIRKVRKHKTRYFSSILKTQSMNSGKYVTLSNLEPFFLLCGQFESGSKISPV